MQGEITSVSSRYLSEDSLMGDVPGQNHILLFFYGSQSRRDLLQKLISQKFTSVNFEEVHFASQQI